jgi:hypothetical protein
MDKQSDYTVRAANIGTAPAVKALSVCAAGVIAFGVVKVFQIPLFCIWKVVFGIPCPGCGLTRAFTEICRFDFLSAERWNILSVPLALGLLVVAIWAVGEVAFKSGIFSKLQTLISRKPIIVSIIVATAASWVYNIIIGI